MVRRLVAPWLRAFAGLPREAWILAVATWINRSGSMVLTFLVIWLTKERGFDAEGAGRCQTLYGVAAIVGSWVGGALSDRIGAKRVQIASLTFAGVLFLALGLAETRPQLLVALALLGLGNEMLRPANLTAIADSVPENLRTRAIALYRLAVNLGESSGALLGGFLAAHDFRLVFVVDGVTALAAAFVLLLCLRALPPSPRVAERPPLLPLAPLRDGPFVVIFLLSLGLFVVLFQLMSTVPLFLTERYRLDEQRIGTLFAINTTLIIVFEMLLVRRLEAKPPLVLTAAGAALLCLGLGVLPLGSEYAVAAGGMMVLTFGEMLWSPFLSTWVAQRAGPGRRGSYIGCYMLAAAVAFAIAPLVGTTAYARIAPEAPFVGALVLGLPLALGFLAVHRATRCAPEAPI